MAGRDDELVVRTRVGRAIPNGNLYFGYRVEQDFLDEDGYWRGMLLGMGAGPEQLQHLRLVKRLAGCTLVADPRIWPLKAARLAASFGSAIAGVCAGNVFLEGGMIGPVSAEQGAAFLCDIDKRWDGTDSCPALVDELARRRAKGDRFPGFGIPFREVDERVAVVDRIVAEEGRGRGRYWRCALAVEAALSGRRPLPRNLVGAGSAALLDCGFTPKQVGLIMWSYGLPTYVANAVEGAAMPAPVLRNLPPSTITYRGPPLRISPRARKDDK